MIDDVDVTAARQVTLQDAPVYDPDSLTGLFNNGICVANNSKYCKYQQRFTREIRNEIGVDILPH
jgi:hypothetical protein